MSTSEQAPGAMDYYRSVFARRSTQELHTLAHIKRVIECVIGDPDFRREALETRGQAGALLASRGIKRLDLSQLLAFKDDGIDLNWQGEDMSKYPLAKQWVDFIAELREFRYAIRNHAGTPEKNPRFDAWRRRQVSRSDSELGDKETRSLVHAIFAFELSKGCSVGCWFCGLSAGPLQEVFAYTPENAALWRDVLQAGVDLFGRAMQCGTCYWATEPTDNPNYLDFIEDFRRITGELPQTTTALPLRDLAWTREVIRLQKMRLSVPTRFSILSTDVLRRVHEAFSPEELLHVECLHQHQSFMFAKAEAGRARKPRKRPSRSGTCGDGISGGVLYHHHKTIACLSGFLVNMPDRSIRLISPCPASDRWPLGYRVHAEGQFADAAEFRAFIERSIDECMPEHVDGDEAVAFRKDLTYSPLAEGFLLANEYVAHKFTGEPFLSRLGSLIQRGDKTAGQVIDALLRDDTDIFVATTAIQDLFEKGLLDDERFIRRRRQEVDA